MSSLPQKCWPWKVLYMYVYFAIPFYICKWLKKSCWKQPSYRYGFFGSLWPPSGPKSHECTVDRLFNLTMIPHFSFKLFLMMTLLYMAGKPHFVVNNNKKNSKIQVTIKGITFSNLSCMFLNNNNFFQVEL